MIASHRISTAITLMVEMGTGMKWLPGPENLIALTLLVLAPASIARLAIGASWLQIGSAFLIWTMLLWILIGGPKASNRSEGIGWTLITSMFVNWIGVPATAFFLRAANLP